MNEREIGEIRRRVRRDRSNMTAIYGCYVNENKEIISQFKQSTGITVMNYILKTRIISATNLLESTDLPIGEISEKCGFSSTAYFCRVFKTVTQKAAMEYLRDYRIDIADIMLKNTGAGVSEIAEQCGFDDTNYFCRCYKLRYGVSPGRRKTSKKEK